MTDLCNYQLSDKYEREEGTVFLSGIQALARLPLEQLRADRLHHLSTAAFISGYQGSPLGAYGEAVASAARSAPDLPIRFQPGFNEELAATAVMGSQLAASRHDAIYDGVVGVWYGKAPGVDRAADALRHAVFAGSSMHGGAIAIVGDDPAAKSSTVPSSSAGVVSDMHMPLLYPGDPGEALDLGLHAIALSRATGLWAALKIVADVADATASIDLHPDRVQPVVPLVDGQPYRHLPDGRLLTPRTLDIEREIIEVRYELAREYAAANQLNHVSVDSPSAWMGIVSSGITYREVREALARLGLRDDAAVADAGIRLLKMGMPMPFNPGTVRAFAVGLQEIFVVEEKLPTIESQLKDALYASAHQPIVIGKQDEAAKVLLPGWGALDADSLVPVLRRRLEARLGDRLIPDRPKRSVITVDSSMGRTPFFCSGCPHNRSTAVPVGTAVGAGIGCHTMTLLMDEQRVGDITGISSMGGEGAQWIGMSTFVETDHLIQNVGDGTFFHSAQLAVQAAIAANVNITYKLLYNGTVAMTGGQDPQGQLTVAEISSVLLTQGVSRVLITTDDPKRVRNGDLPKGVDVWDRTRLTEAHELLAHTAGVTVLIHDQACAAELRRARKRGRVETPPRRVVINHRICEGCGDCGRVSNCLSVQPFDTPFGRKTKIDQATCNLDFSCLEGDCPSFMVVTRREPGRLAKLLGLLKSDSTPRPAPGDPPTVAVPTMVVPVDEFTMRIVGIGGTGVVTVAQILGTAATLDGFHTRGLDQVGMSQKAGPVISDVRLSSARPSFTNRLGEAQADLLLVFDQLVAGSQRGLIAADPDRTVVVGSTSTTPTGAMITHPEIAFPTPDELGGRIAEQTRPGGHWANAHAITADLVGSSAASNLFVVGMAVQAGAIPIDPTTIERSIELNGVVVPDNIRAFRWGRVQVANPQAVEAARAAVNPPQRHKLVERFPDRLDHFDVPGDIRESLSMFASELTDWGSADTAGSWFDVLERVFAAERRVSPSGTDLLATVAAGLYKLTAFKDEYEVARLMIDADGFASAREVAGPAGKIGWKLHPPVLRSVGVSRKITIGSWAVPMMRLLAGGKRLRGTVLDPFGHTEIRRIERSLSREYVAALDAVLEILDSDNLQRAIALAELPDLVRGFEAVKLDGIARFREQLSTALAGF